jgi:hypothetical protein
VAARFFSKPDERREIDGARRRTNSWRFSISPALTGSFGLDSALPPYSWTRNQNQTHPNI